MSLLHQEQQDDAARGEELTRGTSHVVIAAVVAAVVVSFAIAAYFFAGREQPMATGEVISVWAHPQHTETSGFDAGGAVMPKETFDQVMVFANVRLHNQSKLPLFLTNIVTNVTLDDGIHSSYAAAASEYDRVFVAYPNMPVPHGKALPLTTEIDPGQTVEGTFISAFKMDKGQWDARKALNFTFAFRYQPSLVLTPQVSVTEQ
jgi:hypothetical protein